VSKRREGRLSGSFALESPEKIRGIEKMDKELSFQFEDGELQREEEKEEEEAGSRGRRRRRRSRGRRRRMWTSRGRRMRSLCIGL
jgi:hypothetical protein